MTKEELKKIIDDHALWHAGKAGAGANLAGANLARADFTGAYLDGANLAGANLARADFTGAYLDGANLAGANLARADFTGAYLDGNRKVVGLVARLTRIEDPYEFFAWRTDGGDYIKAGCHFFTPAEYRTHVAASYPGTMKAAETLRIIGFIEDAFASTAMTVKEAAE